MSAERDELARIIMSPESFDGGPVSCGPNAVYAARIADAILSAGYRKPRTITTEEELDALPNRSFVQGYDGFRHEKQTNGWLILLARVTELHTSDGIDLPATVLYSPEVAE